MSQCHEFRLEGLREGLKDATRKLGSLDLKITAARSQKDKTLEVSTRIYTISDGNFVNTRKTNGLFTSLSSFTIYFVTSF